MCVEVISHLVSPTDEAQWAHLLSHPPFNIHYLQGIANRPSFMHPNFANRWILAPTFFTVDLVAHLSKHSMQTCKQPHTIWRIKVNIIKMSKCTVAFISSGRRGHIIYR